MPYKQSILRALTIAFLVQIGFSLPLWFGNGRTFPMVGLFNVLESIGNLTPFALVLALILFLIFPSKKETVWGVLAAMLIAVLPDVHRLQPWVWFYFLAFLAAAFSSKKTPFQAIFLFFIAFFYIWSGLNKLNVWYESSEFPWLLEPITFLKYLSHESSFAYSSALVEAGLGAALLFSKTRRWAMAGLVFFHLIILYLLGPLGHDWNYVVWPWNLALVAVFAILDVGEQNEKRPVFYSVKNFLSGFWPSIKGKVYLNLVILLPLLGMCGFFEKNLSFYLYTNLTDELTLFWDKKGRTKLPKVILEKDKYERQGECRLQLADWSMRELKVPPYNSMWAMKKTGDKAAEMYLPIDEKTGYFTLEVKRWSKSDMKTESYHLYSKGK